MELNDEENQSPALLSARNSALSVFDEVFADEDEDDIKAVDDDAMPQLRYSIGTTGDRRHLHRLAQDIHGAHKQADCRGLDLHRALNARKAESTNKADELCRIPAWRPQMTRAKSCGLLLPSLLPFKRKSEPSEKLRAALASYDSPPKPRKTVSFANLAAALRSSRSSSPDNDEDEDEADPASPADIWDDDHAAQGHEWGEWVAQDGWGWEPPHVEPQLSGGMPFAMGQPMMVPMMNGNGDVFYVPQQMAVPQQMMPQQMMAGNVGYPAGFAMEAGFEYYAAVPMMPQQLPPHMAQHMMMPMMQPMQNTFQTVQTTYQQTILQPQVAGVQKMAATVPFGMYGGMQMTVNTPHGQMRVTIPPGYGPGSSFTFNVPTAGGGMYSM